MKQTTKTKIFYVISKSLLALGVALLVSAALSACGRKQVVIEKQVETVVVTKIEPCTTAAHENGVVLICGDMDPVLIENGSNGANGINGEDGEDGSSTVVTLVTPCQDTAVPQSYPEVLVCIGGETLFAVLTNNDNMRIRLVELLEGVIYNTTDGRSCSFTVEAACQLSY